MAFNTVHKFLPDFKVQQFILYCTTHNLKETKNTDQIESIFADQKINTLLSKLKCNGIRE